MSNYAFQLVNVFAETPFGGNPLAVFTDARGLNTETMQAIAQQMNLSETTFITPSLDASAAVRILTPAYEMPFAGHPTLGSAAVLAQNTQHETLTLSMPAGIFTVIRTNTHWVFSAQAAQHRSVPVTQRAAFADTLGLNTQDILEARFINSGHEQLLIKIAHPEAVLAARPQLAGLLRYCKNEHGHAGVYLWSEQQGIATVRQFLVLNAGQILEDPGTGSACANLGAWLAADGVRNLQWRVEQGHILKRPNVLSLRIDAEGTVWVGGQVQFIGHGELTVP